MVKTRVKEERRYSVRDLRLLGSLQVWFLCRFENEARRPRSLDEMMKMVAQSLRQWRRRRRWRCDGDARRRWSSAARLRMPDLYPRRLAGMVVVEVATAAEVEGKDGDDVVVMISEEEECNAPTMVDEELAVNGAMKVGGGSGTTTYDIGDIGDGGAIWFREGRR
ncbi:hypothetical protein LR48_Vigan03g101300 [Vigna angularis]|uniref:Uncharacterized protein n=1 Tax=Phaseolus angularis TaxID=3914 RepID=A0A0L9U4C8_PHAAN|nr:hypothetical protein LR48_Vigan03g101300 [Vigna angularis]